jgi:hypothetical protein
MQRTIVAGSFPDLTRFHCGYFISGFKQVFWRGSGAQHESVSCGVRK